VYYDLHEKQQADKRDDVAIIRMEQLYPLPMKQLNAELAKYKKPEIVWVQEEPENMGSFSFMLRRFRDQFTGAQALRYVGRESASSPATGFAKLHTQEQAALVQKAFE
jgi:2-oxoglutarate dehydrogenase E1 component